MVESLNTGSYGSLPENDAIAEDVQAILSSQSFGS